MGHKPSTWTHKKYRSRKYVGHYRIVSGEREFVLTALKRDGKLHNVTFESHEAAKELGWKRKK